MNRIFAIANQKGGVGKTTTAVNLAASLAVAEKRTLLLDLDPQANAGSGFGLEKKSIKTSIYNLLEGSVAVSEVIVKTQLQYLDILPSNDDLIGAEIELVEVKNRERVLKNVLFGICENYDYILIDCPPSLGLLTVNALSAAKAVLIPVQCEYYAMEGLSSLVRTIELIQNRYNPCLTIGGIVLTMYDGRNNLSKQVSDELHRYFPKKVFEAIIPRNVRLSEAPSHGLPALLYDVSSKGARAYLELAQEIIDKGL
ncbi:MAG: ParA family protein [Desulfuromonadaceae bacterium]|nr:ParA family protein [Desulfuromonadaceae bacterium]